MEKTGKVVSFFSPKGGTGKSTLTAVTATALNYLLNDKDVCIIDGDFAQNTIMIHREKEEERLKNDDQFKFQCEGIKKFPVFVCEKNTLVNTIEACKKKFDLILVDFPGTLIDDEILKAVLCVNYMILPVGIDEYEVNSVLNFIDNMLPLLKDINKDIKVKALMNMYSDSFENKNKVNPYETLKNDLNNHGIEVFSNKVYKRIEISRNRSTIIPLAYKPGKDSIYNFFKEFISFIK